MKSISHGVQLGSILGPILLDTFVLHSGQQLVTTPSTQQNQKNIKLKQTSDKSFESI